MFNAAHWVSSLILLLRVALLMLGIASHRLSAQWGTCVLHETRRRELCEYMSTWVHCGQFCKPCSAPEYPFSSFPSWGC